MFYNTGSVRMNLCVCKSRILYFGHVLLALSSDSDLSFRCRKVGIQGNYKFVDYATL